MNIKEIQTHLKLDADGIAGNNTIRSIKEYFKRAYPNLDITKWNNKRLLVAMEQAIYSENKLPIITIDGLVGEQTRHVRELWNAKKTGNVIDTENVLNWRDKIESKFNAWPTQSQVSKFYGKPGQNQTTLNLPWNMYLAWDRKQVITKFSCHEKVHDAMLRCFEKIGDVYPDANVRKKLGIDLWGGCLNVRKMRGGSNWSMHSWGIAIDFDPDRNQLRWGRDKARLAKPDCEAFWRIWEEEGAVSLGRSRNFDWMHVQFCLL